MLGPKHVYVASAYTSPRAPWWRRLLCRLRCVDSPELRNVHRSLKAATELRDLGLIVYPPLLCHWWDQVFPASYEVWLRLVEGWLSRCDCVLRLPGPSKGADHEVALAGELGIPVFYSVEDLVAWARERAA